MGHSRPLSRACLNQSLAFRLRLSPAENDPAQHLAVHTSPSEIRNAGKIPLNIHLALPQKGVSSLSLCLPFLHPGIKKKAGIKKSLRKKQHCHGYILFALQTDSNSLLALCATRQKQNRKGLRKKSDYWCALELCGRLLIMRDKQSRDTQGAESWDSLRWELGDHWAGKCLNLSTHAKMCADNKV